MVLWRLRFLVNLRSVMMVVRSELCLSVLDYVSMTARRSRAGFLIAVCPPVQMLRSGCLNVVGTMVPMMSML